MTPEVMNKKKKTQQGEKKKKETHFLKKYSRSLYEHSSSYFLQLNITHQEAETWLEQSPPSMALPPHKKPNSAMLLYSYSWLLPLLPLSLFLSFHCPWSMKILSPRGPIKACKFLPISHFCSHHLRV